MKVLVPANIKYEDIFKPWESKRIDKRLNLENTVYIILDYMLKNGNIWVLWYEVVELHSPMFKKICNQNFFDAMPVLIKMGVIKQNLDDGNYEPLISSKKYNLAYHYCMGGIVEIELKPSSVQKNYQRFQEKGYLHKINLNEGFSTEHLLKQFEGLEIQIMPEIETYKAMYLEEMTKYLRLYWSRKKLRYLILSKMGQMEQNVADLYSRQFNPTQNVKNLRFHSLFTNILKELRSFIRVNGNHLIEFDLKSSNAYVLACILSHDFFYQKKHGLNLNTTFKLLSNKIDNLNKTKEQTKTRGTRTEAEAGGARRRIPYMCPTFYERDDVILFRKIPFEEGFYEHLIAMAKENHEDLIKRFPTLIKRDSVKKMVLSYLTDTEKKHRRNMTIVKLMGKIYPSICEFIDSLLVFKHIDSAMAYLLQRTEAFLVLEILAKKLMKELDLVKIFTIHDCLLIEDNDLNKSEIISKIQKILVEYTGIKPGVSIKKMNPISDVFTIVGNTVNKLKVKSQISEKIGTQQEKRIFSQYEVHYVKVGINMIFGVDKQQEEARKFENFIESLYG
ncbi:MAG: hypothetical protein K2X26_05905 [Chitinophagaceae bacterium]|nr:hypothetical protein [Chitinophagaceae bacterium]